MEIIWNDYRITQTDEKIRNEDITGDYKASKTHLAIGKKVRETIKDIGGTMPEELPPEQHVEEIAKQHKKALKTSKT